jgi:transcription antitermination factor NusG
MMLAITTTELVPPAVPTAAAGHGEQRWFAAYTCANHEKRVVEHFEARAVEHFLPLYASARRWKDRRVQLELPLFPGYVFVRIALGARLRVLEVPGVVHLVGFGSLPVALSDSEIESLRGGLAQQSRVEPHPYLRTGKRVRVTAGPFSGSEGILLRRKGAHRVVLSLDLIMRSLAVEVDLADVQAVLRRL